MRILHLTLEELHSKLHVIGFAAENLHTRMVIDCTRIFIEYPGAVASMAVQPPTGDTYPATISTNGSNVIWDITNSDLKYPGEGRVQLTFMLEDVAVKTYIGKVVIMKSLMATGSVPDPLEDFIAKAEKMLQDLEEAKESGEFDGPPGPQGPEGPAGADGKDGAPGRDGKDGADGAPGRDGADGKDGADGAPGADGVTYTPSVSSEGVISWTNDGNRQNPSPVNIKGPAGPAGADGQQGPAGQDGQDATPDLIAAAYEDLTYPVSAGTLCYNGEVLYRAKQDIPTSESWTAGHWDATTVADELSRQNGAITANRAMIADAETSTTAAHAHAVKTVFILNNKLLMTLSAIAVGDTITTTGATPNAAEVTLADAFPHDVQVNGVSVVNQGVANVPIAGENTLGLVKVAGGSSGIEFNSANKLRTIPASTAEIKSGSDGAVYKPITPPKQHQSVFYGLASASGDTTQSSSSNTVGVYTESAKSKISDMLDAPETVSGTTPSITAKAGVRYICGEVATLTIVVPASGIIDVTFDSGSTPTVLTVTPPTGMTMKWANGFDSTSLEANTTYEINIADGCLGVAGSWT